LRNQVSRSHRGSGRRPRDSRPPHSSPLRSTSAKNGGSPVRTFGERFPDGSSIELVRDSDSGELSLLYAHGSKDNIASRIRARNCVFVPGEIDSSLLEATSLPRGREPHGSTDELFAATCDLFTTRGFSEAVACASAFLSFSSWRLEKLEIAPCLAIAGPRAEAVLLFQVLKEIVRWPLRIGECNRGALCSVPHGWRPTILLDHESERSDTASLLATTSQRGSRLPWRGTFIDTFCAKAVYCGPAPALEDLGLGVIRISVDPIRGRVPILDSDTQRRISSDFQARFLDYRLANQAVSNPPQFDVPNASSHTRILGDIFRASVVNGPKSAARIEAFLRVEEDQARMVRWQDPRCIVVEALLVLCRERRSGEAHIGEISKCANAILHFRGVNSELTPRQVGQILRELGFRAKRDQRGFSLQLTEILHRQAQELGRTFQVAAIDESEPPGVAAPQNETGTSTDGTK